MIIVTCHGSECHNSLSFHVYINILTSPCPLALALAAAMPLRNPASVPPPAPDSPRSSLSPTPAGLQGDLEGELLALANELYNLGTTVVNDSTKEKDKDKSGGGKQVGLRVCALFPPLSICIC